MIRKILFAAIIAFKVAHAADFDQAKESVLWKNICSYLIQNKIPTLVTLQESDNVIIYDFYLKEILFGIDDREKLALSLKTTPAAIRNYLNTIQYSLQAFIKENWNYFYYHNPNDHEILKNMLNGPAKLGNKKVP